MVDWDYLASLAPKKPKPKAKKEKNWGSDQRSDQQVKKQAEQSRLLKMMKANQQIKRDEALVKYEDLREWYEILNDELPHLRMRKLGRLCTDFTELVDELSLVKLPMDIRRIALDLFREIYKKVQVKAGYSKSEDPVYLGNPGEIEPDWMLVKDALRVT